MSQDIPEPGPRSELEDESIPDPQGSAPERARAEDPQQAPAPRDYHVGVDDFGTTADERAGGEPLDHRLARERPDVQPPGDPVADPEPDAGRLQGYDDLPRPSGRLVADDEGARARAEEASVGHEVGPDAGGFSAEEGAVRVEDEENSR